MTRTELLSSPGYWQDKIQNDLYLEVQRYIDKMGITRSALAEKLGVTKGYITQVLNGNSNHKISKLVELALGIGCVPLIHYKSLNQVIYEDENEICHPRNQTSRFMKTVPFEPFVGWVDSPYLDIMDNSLTPIKHFKTKTVVGSVEEVIFD